VPTEVVAHEVYAQLSTPLLWRFLQEMPAKGNDWAAQVLKRITENCGRNLQELWKIRLTATEAPALRTWLGGGSARLGDLLRDPDERTDRLHVVPLLVQRGVDSILTPDDDFLLEPDDELLFAGRSTERRGLENTLLDDSIREYVLYGRHVPASWVWRRLKRGRPPGPGDPPAEQPAAAAGSSPK